MLHLYLTLIALFDRRADRRNERGDVIAFVGIGALVVGVLIVARPLLEGIITTVLGAIGDQIGELT